MNKAYVLLNQRIFILLLALTLVWVLPAGQAAASEVQVNLQWERDFGASIQLINVLDTGNGYSVVGVNKDTRSAYLAKLYADGTVYWDKELELRNEYGKIANLESAGFTQDGGYILGATVTKEHPRYSDYYAAKISPDGSVEWKIEYPSGAHASFDDIHQAKDGGFLYANNTEGWLAGFFQVNAGKLDAHGSKQWSRGLGSGGAMSPLLHADQIMELTDGSYLISGYKDGRTYIWRLDADVNLIQSKEYPSLTASKAVATDDGGYVLAGTELGLITLYKNNASDENISVQALALTGQVESLHTTSKGGYLLGTSKGVYETNSSGDLLWSYEDSGIRKAIPALDGGTAVISGGKIIKLGGSIARLEFDSHSYSLIEGQTLDTVLTAVYGSERKTVTNLDQVVFSSDDESIVTIDSYGNITGHKVGSTYIRATWTGLEAIAEVHVFNTYQALQLDSNEYSVNIGEPIDLAVTYLEGASQFDVTRESAFSTSDPSIAIVDIEGNIIGLKRGQTILTVTYNGLEATAVVDVY